MKRAVCRRAKCRNDVEDAIVEHASDEVKAAAVAGAKTKAKAQAGAKAVTAAEAEAKARAAARAEAEAKASQAEAEEHARNQAEQEAKAAATKSQAAKEAAAAEQPPDHFICPITQDLMIDPVSAADGHTYERRVIQGGLSNTRPAR